MLRCVSSISTLVRVFITNGCWMWSNAFFWLYGDDCMAFVISFIHVVYQSDWFAYFEWSLWPWDESNLIAGYDPSYMLLGFVCSCFVEFLHFLSSNIWSVIFSGSVFVLVLVSQWLYRITLRVFSPLQSVRKFWEALVHVLF